MTATVSRSFLSDKLVSVLIPAYNEEDAIVNTIRDLEKVLVRSGWGYEIIVVDDASTDKTAEMARTTAARVISHPKNIGYGGALRTGIDNASYEWVATIDADCSYPAEELLKLLPFTETHDMVVGARQGKHYWGTFLKYPARILFLALAQFVVGKKIPDVNSGLRMMRKSIVVEMLPRLCRGFSFSTTLTLSFLSSFRFVHFVPIVYSSRVGSSKVRYIRDTLRTLQLMLETIVYYNPLKAGVLLMMFPFAVGAACVVLAAVKSNLLLLLAGFGFFCWAILFLGLGLLMFVVLQANQQNK
jgi:glycosyltransferase involved in cell wall biosynthesis